MKLIITAKMLDARHIGISPKCVLHIHEGTTRSSKTVTAIEEFMDHLHESKETLHLIAAADLDAIRDNILEADLGLLNLYPEAKLKKTKIGGFFLSVKSHYKDDKGKQRCKWKKVLLVGYTNIDKWRKILGKTLGTILVDEVNIANKQFILECFSRQASCDNPLAVWTLNGDTPTHYIYQEFINHAVIVGDAPVSIRAEMDPVPKIKGFYYQHWTMEDNPIMTKEKIDRLLSIYPVGSYYYTTKALGERGAPGILIYIDYMSTKLIKKLCLREYSHFGIGVDIGASRAQNSYTLVGFEKDFKYVGIISKMTFQNVGYTLKTDKLKAFVQYWSGLGANIDYIAIDSAEANYIADLKSEFKQLKLPPIIESYKATIKQRIDMVIILMARGMLSFNDTQEGKNTYDAFRNLKWVEGEEGKEREDNNQWFNDVADSLEYALTRHMNKLMKASKEQIYE